MVLEREVEEEYRPLMRAELQRRVEAVARTAQIAEPACPHCGRTMSRKDIRSVSWLARFGKLCVPVSRFVCRACRVQCRPLLDLLGV
jgi:transposase-like protein